MNKRICIMMTLASISLSGAASAATATAWACDGDSFSNKVNEKISALTSQACEQLSTEPSLDGNPFAYKNPNQSTCDLGIPGLADWDGINYDVDGASMCEVVKTVVGDQVRQLGGQIDAIGDYINDNFSASGGVDVQSAIESVVGN